MPVLVRTTTLIGLLAIAGAARATSPVPDTPANELFKHGYETPLQGHVADGVRIMEQADAQGARGARFRLCKIYAEPSHAKGGNRARLKAKCPAA